MKKLLAFSLLIAASGVSCVAAEWRTLFDGSMNGWQSWLAYPHESTQVSDLARGNNGKYTEPLGWNRDPLGVFSIVEIDGRKAIRSSGQVYGLLLTKEPLSNFHLKMQFKWGEKRWAPRLQSVRDSGLLYFVNGEQGRSYVSWPSCLELQIQQKDCGDLYALLSDVNVRAKPHTAADGQKLFTYDPAAKPVLLAQEGPDGNRCIRQQDFEKPEGEWNTIELICLGADSIHIVNGHVVMRLAGARKQPGGEALSSGLVGLQSEGAEIFFRDIQIQSISAVPEKYEEYQAK